jgi:hypothetical protein
MYYLWVSNDGTLGIVTIGFSHELVEACTDPDGNGIQINPRSSSNWNEIGDICESEIGIVNGVQVQKYWSKSALACVVPTQPDNPIPAGANRLITVNAKFVIAGALNTSAPNTETFSFTRTIPLNNNQTTGEIVITTDKIVKNNLSANVVLSFTWHNDLSVSVKFTSAFFLGVNAVTSYANNYTMGAGGAEYYTVGHEINNNTDTCKIIFNTLNG